MSNGPSGLDQMTHCPASGHSAAEPHCSTSMRQVAHLVRLHCTLAPRNTNRSQRHSLVVNWMERSAVTQMDQHERFVRRHLRLAGNTWREDYINTHFRRYVSTLLAIPSAPDAAAAAMEVGTYGLFLQAFRDLFGYSKVEGTTFENPGDTAKSIQRSFDFDPEGERFTLYDMNLENTQIPVDDQSFDFVLAAEVIEHFSTDPNFFFFEANRILKHGGRLLITTPNVVCSENVFRILWRQVPHRFYFYRKDRSTDRHNLEYGPDLLKLVIENAGLAVERMWSEDSWCERRPDIEELIRNAGFPDSLRGDNLFFLCVKVSEPKERFPDFLYH